MGKTTKATLVRLLERQLMEDYDRALTHAVRYHSSWRRAEEAYARLWAFREALAWSQQGANRWEQEPVSQAA